MSEHVYKIIELTGTSPKDIEDAVKNAVTRAGETVRNMRWLESPRHAAISKTARSRNGK